MPAPLPKRFVFNFFIQSPDGQKPSLDITHWFPVLADPGITTGELSPAEYQELIQDPMDKLELESKYGVHDISFSEATDLAGFTTYEVEAGRIPKLMKVWADILTKGGFTLGQEVSVTKLQHDEPAKYDGAIRRLTMPASKLKIDFSAKTSEPDFETALTALLDNSGATEAITLLNQIISKKHYLPPSYATPDRLWQALQILASDSGYSLPYPAVISLAKNLGPLSEERRTIIGQWFLNHPEKKARISGATLLAGPSAKRALARPI